MLLVDTSAWIEWLIDSQIGEAVGAELPSRDVWLVPTIVQLELAKWASREVGEEKADQIVAFTERCVVVKLDTSLALSAADNVRASQARDRRCHHLRDGPGARRRRPHL